MVAEIRTDERLPNASRIGNELYERMNASLATVSSTTLPVPSVYSVSSNQFTIGISLALLSSLFIGSSFILKKKGLLRLTNSLDAVRAGSFIRASRRLPRPPRSSPSIGRLRVSVRDPMVGRRVGHGTGRGVQFRRVWIRARIGGHATRCTIGASQVFAHARPAPQRT